MKISIIITNHNYGQFLRDAIDSARAVRWPDKEVLVVDDGSTDCSRTVMESYGDQIKALFKAKGGQPSAANFAYPHSTGDLIFFLDSDDILLPEVAEIAIKEWNPAVSQVQFPMIVIDSAGKPTGTIYPNNLGVSCAMETAKQRLLQTGIYPNSPTTGNMWSRKLCGRVFPVPEGELTGIDSYLLMAAPLFGDVISLSTPLAKYRVHASNVWAQTRFDPAKLSYYCQQEATRTAYLVARAKELNLRLDVERLLTRNHGHLMTRLSSYRLSPEHPYPSDRIAQLLWRGYRAILSDSSLSAAAKALMLIWFTGVAISPRAVAEYLCEVRYVSVSRPSFLTAAMQSIGVLKRIRPTAAHE